VVTAVVYARFSSELQADRSIDDQVRLSYGGNWVTTAM